MNGVNPLRKINTYNTLAKQTENLLKQYLPNDVVKYIIKSQIEGNKLHKQLMKEIKSISWMRSFVCDDLYDHFIYNGESYRTNFRLEEEELPIYPDSDVYALSINFNYVECIHLVDIEDEEYGRNKIIFTPTRDMIKRNHNKLIKPTNRNYLFTIDGYKRITY
jgi:hypothetical protein